MATSVLSNAQLRPGRLRSVRKRRWLIAAGLALLLAAGLFVWHIKRGVESDAHPVRVVMTREERATTLQALPGARDVTFRTVDGLTLSGWYAPGTNGAAVVLTHGAWSNRSQLTPEASRLLARGYGVLVYDLRANGESEGDLFTWGDRESRDVLAAVDFAAAQAGVTHLGAVGFSVGATALSSAAAKDRRIEAFVLEGATPSLLEAEQWENRRYYGIPTYPSLQMYRWYGWNVDAIDIVSPLRTMAPRPTLIVIGSEDPFIPRWMTDEVVAAAPQPKAEYTVVGAGHGGYATHGGVAYFDRLVGFFDRYLAPEGARAP